MARYRKLPVVIEAVQWDGAQAAGEDIPPSWWSNARIDGSIQQRGDELSIRTKEGVMTASPGDWIVRGIQGEMYPVKDTIFHKTYEPANAA